MTEKITLPNQHVAVTPKKPREIPKVYENIAEGMESQFAKMMIDEMRKTVDKSEATSSAMDFYNSTLDTEYAQVMSKGKGLGLKKLILDQIYPEHMRRPDIQLHPQSAQKIPTSSATGENHEQ